MMIYYLAAGVRPIPHLLTKGLLTSILLYQRAISPTLPPSCRFYPTCSSYTIEAVKRHGLLKGGRLAVVRLLKCHPFFRGGYDPVP